MFQNIMRRTGLFLVLSVSLMLVPNLATDALAGELVFHSFGKELALEKSQTEFAIVMPAQPTPVGMSTAGARNMIRLEEPTCVFKSLPWAMDSEECQIVEVPKADLATRDRIRAIPSVATARPVYRFAGSDHPLVSSGNLVVQLRDSLTAEERTQFFVDFKVRMVRVLDAEQGIYICCPEGDVEEDEVRCAMAMHIDHRTVFAHPDFAMGTSIKQVFSQFNDEFLGQQWHLKNTGQDLGTVGADINVEDAWRFSFGEDVLIGMFDDAVEILHEDLERNYVNRGHDAFLQTEGANAPRPRILGDSHGTNVIGLAIAASNNQFGIVGVAPTSRFTASRGLLEPFITLGQIAGAFTFARQQNVDIHNNSWGIPGVSNLALPVIVSQIEAAYNNGRDGKGMVIVFASGNSSVELGADDDLSTLPTVIGVGASTGQDRLASYSNYGADINFLAPGGGVEPPMMVTTDNPDDNPVSPGFNFGGLSESGQPDLSDSSYTKRIIGTSFACPVVTGAAALLVSINQNLTAEQVRVLLEHTCEQIDPLEANYHPITQRSLTHGYGRIDIGRAADIADRSLDNNGSTWPERIESIEYNGGVIRWVLGDKVREIDDDDNQDTPPLRLGDQTQRTLVVESQQAYSHTHFFRPTDFETYNVGDEVSPGIRVVQFNPSTTFLVESSSVKRYYALFPQNPVGRYAFGVTIDTDGATAGTPGSGGSDGGGGALPPPTLTSRPKVSILVTPLSGQSPLDVSFRANAVSEAGIQELGWTFDDDTTSDSATVSHRYVVTDLVSRRFFPFFKVTDLNGNEGIRSVAVDVSGEIDANVIVPDLQISIGLPGVVGSDIDTGVAPFVVEMTVGGEALEGTLELVQWDLGDGGTAANTLSVRHTYENNSTSMRTLPISVLVATRVSTGAIVTQSATRFISVLPNPTPTIPANDGGSVSGDFNSGNPIGSNPVGGSGGSGGASSPAMCGGGTAMVMFSMVLLPFMRRKFR